MVCLTGEATAMNRFKEWLCNILLDTRQEPVATAGSKRNMMFACRACSMLCRLLKQCFHPTPDLLIALSLLMGGYQETPSMELAVACKCNQ